MSNLTPVEVVNILACITMIFFLGLQIDVSKTTQNIARVVWQECNGSGCWCS